MLSIPSPRTRKSLSNLHLLETLESRTLLTVAAPVTQLVFLTQPSAPSDSSTLNHFSVELEDASGNVVTKDHGAITLSISSGPISGKLTVKPKNGIASFNTVFIGVPGTYTLTASKGNISVPSSSFDVNGLVFTQMPTNANDNALFTIQVTVKDAAGNTITTPSTMRLKLANPPKGSHLNGIVGASTVDGVATFSNLFIPKTGTFSVFVKDGNFLRESTSFVVNPSTPTKLKIVSTFPSNQISISGQLGPVIVDVLDAQGNLSTNFTSGSPISNGTSNGSSNGSNGSNGSSNATNAPVITLTLQTTLSTETTLGTITTALTVTENATAGVAVFPTSALTLQTPGWYTLTLSAPNLHSQSMRIFIR